MYSEICPITWRHSHTFTQTHTSTHIYKTYATHHSGPGAKTNTMYTAMSLIQIWPGTFVACHPPLPLPALPSVYEGQNVQINLTKDR